MPETPIGQKLVSRILGAKRADLVTAVDRSTPEAQNLASLTLGYLTYRPVTLVGTLPGLQPSIVRVGLLYG